jgi:hypothetical protein
MACLSLIEMIHKLADAVVENALVEQERGRNAYLTCIHCDGSVYWNQSAELIKHNEDCVYLLAQSCLGKPK